MSASRWQYLKEILGAALDLPDDQRETFLIQACGEDGELLKEALTILAAGSETKAFLDEKLADEPTHHRPLGPGKRIGPYRIVRSLGQGGMGLVFLAVRENKHYLGEVAVKVLKRGLDTDLLIERFHRERRIQANLKHPNIAVLFDGGTSEDGLPYFVMEYVRGIPIDAYCRDRNLCLTQRLQLLVKVCGAVHAAHQNLIVHRDLKPGNILVTSEGEPKLLDFGIAKLIENETGGTHALTGRTYHPMTPEYASPEQVMGENITTASDIYSLGVLFYLILTGRRPYEFEHRRDEEIRALVCEHEPPKPSSASSAHLSHKSSAPKPCPKKTLWSWIPGGREPHRRRPRLRGDLDNIILKAMAKNPDRRYISAAQLAEDVRLHLKGFPVRARKRSAFYMANRYFKRNKLLVTTLFLLSLLPLSFDMARSLEKEQLARERDQAQKALLLAEKEAETAKQVTEFLVQMFESAEPGQKDYRQITAEQILERGYQKISGELADQPQIRARLMTVMGQVHKNLGAYQKSQDLLEEGLAIRKKLFGPSHLEVAHSLRALGILYRDLGDYPKGERYLREALVLRKRRLGNDHLDTALSQEDLGLLLFFSGRLEDAEHHIRRSLAVKEKLLGPDHEQLAIGLNNLGRLYSSLGRYDRAQSLFRRALAIHRANRGNANPHIVHTLTLLGYSLINMNQLGEAETVFRENLAIAERIWQTAHPELASALHGMGYLHLAKKEWEQAFAYFQDSLQMHLAFFGEQNLNIVAILNNLGSILQNRGEFQASEDYFRHSLALLTQLMGGEHPDAARNHNNLGTLLHQTGEHAAAENQYQIALRILRKHYGENHIYYGITLTNLADSYNRQNRFQMGHNHALTALRILSAQLPADHPRVLKAENVLGDALAGLGCFRNAENLLLKNYHLLRDLEGERGEGTQHACLRLEGLYQAWNKPNMALLFYSP